MSLSPKLSNAAANAAADAVCGLLDNGYLRIYDGAQPSDANTAVGAQVLLAELRFGSPAFAAASGGIAAANAITQDDDANATGTAAWFRAVQSDGSSVVFDGSVATSGANINMNNVAIAQHAIVALSAFSYAQSKQSAEV